MPRKPAQLEMVGGKGPRQRIWDMIREKGTLPWTRLDVTPKDVADDTVRTFVKSLALAGYVKEDGVRDGMAGPHAKTKLFVLMRNIGVEAPRIDKKGQPVTQGLATEQMWRHLRTHSDDVNSRELASFASTPKIVVSEVAAADYLRNLHLAGYLICTQRGIAGGGRRGRQARYKLRSNTGPKPPMVCRTDAIYDPNLDETVWIRLVDEEVAIYGH